MKELYEKIKEILIQKGIVFSEPYLEFIFLDIETNKRIVFDLNSGYLALKTTFENECLYGLNRVTSTKRYYIDENTPDCTEKELNELLTLIEKI